MSAQTFGKEEKLKSRKEIENLIRSGKKESSQGIHLYWVEKNEDRSPPVKVLFSAPKKKFKRAVDRNLLKRRMREAYRLNKSDLNDYCLKSNKTMNLMFIYNLNEVTSFEEIKNKIVLLLKGLFPVNESDI